MNVLICRAMAPMAAATGTITKQPMSSYLDLEQIQIAESRPQTSPGRLIAATAPICQLTFGVCHLRVLQGGFWPVHPSYSVILNFVSRYATTISTRNITTPITTHTQVGIGDTLNELESDHGLSLSKSSTAFTHQ